MEEYVRCEICGGEFTQIQAGHLKFHNLTITEYKKLYPDAKIMTDAVREKRSKSASGENNGRWQNGKSNGLYCHKFNEKLKEKIRKRDNYICQLCQMHQDDSFRRHDVHHIHYDRENCDPDLITLCHRCNLKVNENREYWESYFMANLWWRGLVSLVDRKGDGEPIKSRLLQSEIMKMVLADGKIIAKSKEKFQRNRVFINFFRRLQILEQIAYGNLVKCEICGKWLEVISGSHLRFHGISVMEYRQMYPFANTSTDKYIEKLSLSQKVYYNNLNEDDQ